MGKLRKKTVLGFFVVFLVSLFIRRVTKNLRSDTATANESTDDIQVQTNKASEDDDLWIIAKRNAKNSPLVAWVTGSSAFGFGIVTFYTLSYCISERWEWEHGLIYAGITFIAIAGIISQADKISLKGNTAIALSRTGTNVDTRNLEELAKKKILGWISIAFLLVGVLCEYASLGFIVTSY